MKDCRLPMMTDEEWPNMPQTSTSIVEGEKTIKGDMNILAPEGAKLHADGDTKGGTMMENTHGSESKYAFLYGVQ